MNTNKVIIKGRNVTDAEPFCIVKHGDFAYTEEDFVQALKAGVTDKTGEFAPDDKVLAFSPSGSGSAAGSAIYDAVFSQVHDNGRDTAAVFSATVTFVKNT